MSAHNRAKVIPPGMTPEQEEDFYFRETDHNTVVDISVDSFTKDVMCSKCGMWKSEHAWEICKDPNYL